MTATSRLGHAPCWGWGLGVGGVGTVSWRICDDGFAVLLPAIERDLGRSHATLVGAFTTP